MIKLSQAEEQLMEYIWQQEKSFMKDLIEAYPEPKPASTTIATLLKRMTEKKVIDYEQMGNSRQYYPLVEKKDYFAKHLHGMIENFFDNSTAKFASFFAQETNLSKKQLEELKKIVDNEIKKKK